MANPSAHRLDQEAARMLDEYLARADTSARLEQVTGEDE